MGWKYSILITRPRAIAFVHEKVSELNDEALSTVVEIMNDATDTPLGHGVNFIIKQDDKDHEEYLRLKRIYES